ncbi:hypothetical protein ACP70R_018674 [Stipagrostis hirtigluma subsp. patula]
MHHARAQLQARVPLASGVEDLLVISIGRASPTWWIKPWPWRLDIIGQLHTHTGQATGSPRASRGAAKGGCVSGGSEAGRSAAEEMLAQKNVESVLFRGNKLAEQTNAEKLERFALELAKDRDRRRSSPLIPRSLASPLIAPAAPSTARSFRRAVAARALRPGRRNRTHGRCPRGELLLAGHSGDPAASSHALSAAPVRAPRAPTPSRPLR